MSKEARKLGPNTLAQLQNFVKRDPEGYEDEFDQQYEHYKSMLSTYFQKPEQVSMTELEKLVHFLAAVSPCYPKKLKDFPNDLKTLLDEHAESLPSELRHAMCRALMHLQNRSLIKTEEVLQLFFRLFRCPDKALRDMLYSHVVSDIRRLNRKRKCNTLNRAMQSFMYKMLEDDNIIAARRSLDVMIELYVKGVWTDARTVNIIASACLSKKSKLVGTALRFFLKSTDELMQEREEHDEAEEERQAEFNYQSLLRKQKHTKKTQKRDTHREKALRQLRKKRYGEQETEGINFAAIHLINDPQRLADSLYRRLRGARSERFEIRLMMMHFISRLIGVHELFVLDFYSFLQRYLKPHQQDVTRVLAFLAQASHSLVPSDTLESVLMTIANNFVTERSSPEAIAVGLNAIREVCMRCPLAMTPTLLEDLIQYRSFKNKTVNTAARGLIQAYRQLDPSLLPKKFRGRPGEAHDPTQKSLEYGETKVTDVVPGTELLAQLEQERSKAAENDAAQGGTGNDEDVDDDDDDDDDSDLDLLDDLPRQSKVVPGLRMKGPQARKLRLKYKDNPGKLEDLEIEAQRRLAGEEDDEEDPEAAVKERNTRAKELSATHVLTQEDFKRIRKLRENQITSGKRTSLETTETLDEEDIIPEMKKPKQDKEARMELVYNGRADRPKFGRPKGRVNEHASTTNREKSKAKMAKNPMLLKASRSFKSKKKVSMHMKQVLEHRARKTQFGGKRK